jgi:NADH-quinone oxidoreductase subunit K
MNPQQSLDIYLLLSLGLFTIGVVGVLLRRNAIFILMSIELMLNAANLALVTFARYHASSLEHAMTAHVVVMVVIAVAAVEAAVGIALIVAFYRQNKGQIDVDQLCELKG